ARVLVSGLDAPAGRSGGDRDRRFTSPILLLGRNDDRWPWESALECGNRSRKLLREALGRRRNRLPLVQRGRSTRGRRVLAVWGHPRRLPDLRLEAVQLARRQLHPHGQRLRFFAELRFRRARGARWRLRELRGPTHPRRAADVRAI